MENPPFVDVLPIGKGGFPASYVYQRVSPTLTIDHFAGEPANPATRCRCLFSRPKLCKRKTWNSWQRSHPGGGGVILQVVESSWRWWCHPGGGGVILQVVESSWRWWCHPGGGGVILEVVESSWRWWSHPASLEWIDWVFFGDLFPPSSQPKWWWKVILLGQWLNFKLFGITLFSRENKVQTFFSGSIG